MNILWSKLALVAISIYFLIRLAPLFARWYRRSGAGIMDHPKGLFQHLPHVAMLIHTLLAVLVMLDVNPLPFLPDTELIRNLSSPGPLLVSAAGLLYFIAANIIRFRAVRELRESFEKEVVIRQDHRLITSGPYQFFRHPIYVGNILAELSIGLTLVYWPLILYPLLISFPLWHIRAKKEEQMLVRNYPVEYRDYICCVKRWGFF